MKLWPKNDFQKKRDLDLDLEPISTKINKVPWLTDANLFVKFLSNPTRIVAARAPTDKHTNK